MTQTVCNNGSPHVLILDGDPGLNRMVLEKLAQRSLRGTVAASRRSARRMLGHFGWNLIFLNPAISEEAGETDEIDLLAEIRRTLPEVPVVLVSEQDSSEQALRAMRAGCAEFLVKPIRPDVLEEVLDRYVPNHAHCIQSRGAVYGVYGVHQPL